MKKMNVSRRLITISCLLISLVLNAQKAPMKYGKIDPADLSMTVYPADSSAAAVVLCNYGYFDASKFQFVHQRRIKILKEEGKSYGDFSVPAGEKTTVKGQTVNLENGVPVVTKLGKESIFIERISRNNYRARVAMPNVKAGSVLDIEFYYDGLPSSWSFQQTIPVRWSELILGESEYFSFKKNFVGFVPLSEVKEDRYVAKNVPAFKSEPYINNIDNYLTRFDIELQSIHVPGYYYKDYATTWDAVAEAMRKEESFGANLKSLNIYLNGLEKEIKAVAQTPEERLSKAYEAMKKVKWNKKESIFPSEDGLSYAFNKKIGNVSDINLSLVILLRKLDIVANPVVLSTRENGTLPLFSVSFDKFNYVIASAVIGDKSYLLDATEENLPLGMLPERTINGRGLLINKDSYEWVDLTAKKKDKSVSLLSLKVTPDGLLKGSWSRSSYDYAALDQRTHYKTFNSEDEYLKSLENDNIGLSIENFKMIDFDSIQKSLKEEFAITLKNRVVKTNDQLFISPIQFNKVLENPFKIKDRKYPVDFVTPRDQSQILNLELPEGYTVEQLPKNLKLNLPDNTASFQMQSSVNENKIQILFKLNINKAEFFQLEYSDLQTFFDELVKKQAEMIIIKKV